MQNTVGAKGFNFAGKEKLDYVYKVGRLTAVIIKYTDPKICPSQEFTGVQYWTPEDISKREIATVYGGKATFIMTVEEFNTGK